MRTPTKHPTYGNESDVLVLLGDVFYYEGDGAKQYTVVGVQWIAHLREFWVVRAGLKGEVFDSAAIVYRPEHMKLRRRA